MTPLFRLMVMLLATILVTSCAPPTPSEDILLRIPIQSPSDLLTHSGVSIDPLISSDGNGSARIESSEPITIRIAELEPPPFDTARIIYRARLRTQGLAGKTYLEMWCSFTGQGEYFSRSLHDPVTGTTEWTTIQTPFILQENQVPNRIRLNLVIDGAGTVWIDDVVLSKAAT